MTFLKSLFAHKTETFRSHFLNGYSDTTVVRTWYGREVSFSAAFTKAWH